MCNRSQGKRLTFLKLSWESELKGRSLSTLLYHCSVRRRVSRFKLEKPQACRTIANNVVISSKLPKGQFKVLCYVASCEPGQRDVELDKIRRLAAEDGQTGPSPPPWCFMFLTSWAAEEHSPSWCQNIFSLDLAKDWSIFSLEHLRSETSSVHFLSLSYSRMTGL